MRSPDAVYDPALNVPTKNQSALGRAFFEVAQKARQEMAPDDDTPGKLTTEEIFMVLMKGTGLAEAMMESLQDETTLGDDLSTAGYIVTKQLQPFSKKEDEGEDDDNPFIGNG